MHLALTVVLGLVALGLALSLAIMWSRWPTDDSAEIAELTRERDAERARAEAQANEIGELRSERSAAGQRLRDTLTDLKSAVEAMRGDSERRTARLEQQLSDASARAEALRAAAEERDDARSELERVRAELSALRELYATVTQQLCELERRDHDYGELRLAYDRQSRELLDKAERLARLEALRIGLSWRPSAFESAPSAEPQPEAAASAFASAPSPESAPSIAPEPSMAPARASEPAQEQADPQAQGDAGDAVDGHAEVGEEEHRSTPSVAGSNDGHTPAHAASSPPPSDAPEQTPSSPESPRPSSTERESEGLPDGVLAGLRDALAAVVYDRNDAPLTPSMRGSLMVVNDDLDALTVVPDLRDGLAGAPLELGSFVPPQAAAHENERRAMPSADLDEGRAASNPAVSLLPSPLPVGAPSESPPPEDGVRGSAPTSHGDDGLPRAREPDNDAELEQSAPPGRRAISFPDDLL